jgi:hypothetical protein
MLELQAARSLPTLYFWGTIAGPVDYTILVSIEVGKGIRKRFFYSAADKTGLTFKFFELPTLDDFINAQAPKASGFFRGKPGFRLPFPEEEKIPGDEDDDSDPLDDDDESTDQPPLPMFPDHPRKLLEVERLAYVVRTIDRHTAIVPRGRWVMTPTAQIQPNPAFKGLSVQEAQQMNNFMFFRTPERIETLRGLYGPMMANTTAFLDDLGQRQDMLGLWSCHMNFEETRLTLRSLLCPGAEFWLDVNDPSSFGCIYQGYGELNNSLVFMLPEILDQASGKPIVPVMGEDGRINGTPYTSVL